jgi:serine/threonine protein phosphatase PrpC
VQIEHAELSLIGDRSENQDRVLIVADDEATLMICVDGMGGHSNGAKAAEVASQTIAQAFTRVSKPVFDPQGFLHLAIGRAHTNLVAMGVDQTMDQRPRATCAICLVQDDSAFWAHVGDSRIYLFRGPSVIERTRDHSHVELLLREGLISETEIADHPMRNFVECCLGGDPRLPGMSITGQKALAAGDMLLACTDGLWSGLGDEEIGQTLGSGNQLRDGLNALGQKAVQACGPYADNTSAVAVRVSDGKALP